MSQPNGPADDEALPAVESYSSFWDAIPLDSSGQPPAGTSPAMMDSDDPYADFLARTEEAAASWLTVEQTDVG